MTNPILERIHKLFQMTTANGCSEEEADTALRMAAGLMARHGIEEDQLSKVEKKNRAKIGQRVSREFKRHQIILAQAAGDLYGCKVLTYSGGKFGLEFIGRPENIEAAEATMFWLMEQMELFYKQALPRGLTVSARAKFRKTFKEACALRVYHRVAEDMMRMQRNDVEAQKATGSTALVVQGHFKQLAEENEQVVAENYGDSLRHRKPMRFTTGSGTAAGEAAGNRVQLRKELN